MRRIRNKDIARSVSAKELSSGGRSRVRVQVPVNEASAMIKIMMSKSVMSRLRKLLAKNLQFMAMHHRKAIPPSHTCIFFFVAFLGQNCGTQQVNKLDFCHATGHRHGGNSQLLHDFVCSVLPRVYPASTGAATCIPATDGFVAILLAVVGVARCRVNH